MMTIAGRTIAAAVTMGLAAAAPAPQASGPRFVWRIGQDAGAPDASPSSGDAGQTAAQRDAEMAAVLRAYEQAHQRRKQMESR